MNLSHEIENKKKIIDAKLTEYLAVRYPEIIYEAMGYSIAAGGKRLRPILLLAACESVGGDSSAALPFACALELIHTYSLIHDDLPAMDNDDYRRGKLTNHKVYGEGMALLAGDGLLNLAYEIMSQACADHFDLASVQAMNALAVSAGTNGMIGGQVVDVISENKKIDKDTLIYMHEHKTAALIQSALLAGALIGHASEEAIHVFKKAGIQLGIAFQIKDDILDVTSTAERLGKPIHSDAKNHKATYVSLFGLEKAQNDYLQISDRAIALLEQVGNSFLIKYAKILVDREE